MEHVREAGERGVAGVPQAVTRIFRQVKRQGSIGAEQPKEADAEPRRCFPALVIGRQAIGAKILAESAALMLARTIHE